MSLAVCKFCGSDNISLLVEVTSESYRAITEIHYDADGSLSHKEGHTERGYGIEEEDVRDYECGECNATSATLAGLVCPANAMPSGTVCACGHPLADHPPQRKFDRTLYTTGRRSCQASLCGCWEFETDPALATVVRAA